MLGEELQDMLGMHVVAVTHLVNANHVYTILGDKRLRNRANGSVVKHVLEVIGEHARRNKTVVAIVALLGRVAGVAVDQILPFLAVDDAGANAVHHGQARSVLGIVSAHGKHEMVNIDFFLVTVIGLIDQIPQIGRVGSHEGGCKVLLVAFKLLDEELGGIYSGRLGIGHLLLVEDKTLDVLIEGLLLDLLLIVLVIQVLKLRELDVLTVNSHQDRIPTFSHGENRSSQQQRRNPKFCFHFLGWFESIFYVFSF